MSHDVHSRKYQNIVGHSDKGGVVYDTYGGTQKHIRGGPGPSSGIESTVEDSHRKGLRSGRGRVRHVDGVYTETNECKESYGVTITEEETDREVESTIQETSVTEI